MNEGKFFKFLKTCFMLKSSIFVAMKANSFSIKSIIFENADQSDNINLLKIIAVHTKYDYFN